jgi:nicotinate-nucleotide--dimethylbenzimidazole phosphoribosyltransferase
MSDDRWATILVLGGIRSGKSAFAEALVADAPSVRYVATAVGGEDDPEWMDRIEAHQRRRPQSWSTEETGADPARLTELLAEAKPDETLLVDDLGGWVAGLLDPARQPNDDEADVAALADAVRACEARVVLVSPEVGLSLVSTNPIGRAFADALGATNQSVAAACDRVALVVAGRALWLDPAEYAAPPRQPVREPVETVVRKEALPTAEPRVVTPAAAPASVSPAPVAASGALSDATMSLPLVATGMFIGPGMELPLPDDDAGPEALDRLERLDLGGAGLGRLTAVVEFAAATQGTGTPRPWSAPRVLLVSGAHEGGAAAGDDPAEVERRVAQVEDGVGVLSRLAAAAGADVAVQRVAAVGAMEHGPVMDESEVETALRQGWQLADDAADAGRDVLVLASIGVGVEAVATAVASANTGAEAVATLPRVLVPGARYDDNAWMLRCAAIRDALHRIRQESRGARDLLREIGGPDLAVLVGALLGATARRMPVLLDGPAGIAAALVARDLAGQSRHWCLLPDAGRLALVSQGADVIGLTPVLDLGLSLGEGANALAALPLLASAIGLAASAQVHPSLLGEHGDAGLTDLILDNDEDVDFAEPEPGGPGPATSDE